MPEVCTCIISSVISHPMYLEFSPGNLSQRRTVGNVVFTSCSVFHGKKYCRWPSLGWLFWIFLQAFAMILQRKIFPAYFLKLISALSPMTMFEVFYSSKKNPQSHFTRWGPGTAGDGEAAGMRVDLFFAWEEANRRGFMRWRRDKERKWNQAVNLVAAIFDLWLSANSNTALWLDVHAHYVLYSPSRHCKYSTTYSASFCPNIFFHLYCIKTLRPIIRERKNTIFLLYNAFHSQPLY